MVVRIPSTILPGGEFVANVALEAKSDVPVDWVDVLLEGKEDARFGQGNHARRFSHTHARLSARVYEGGTLPKGQSNFACRFALPAGLPPSYRGSAAECSYTLSVHVSIPWWPDRKAAFDINVGTPRVQAPDAAAATYGSHPQGPRGDELTVECSLAERVLEPGGVVHGAIALGNLAYHHVRYVSVALVGNEIVQTSDGQLRDVNDDRRYVMRLPVPEGLGDAETIPFRMRIPERVSASWKSVLWELVWTLDVEAHVRLGRNVLLRIPMTVVPSGSAPKQDRKAPPIIGSERVLAVWSSVAKSLDLNLEGDTLRKRVEDTDVVIRREHRGSDGIFLVAELSFPSLHLGLDGGLRRGFRRVLGGGVECGDATWDRRHYIVARHPEQFGQVLRWLSPVLIAVDLHDIDDGQAVLQSREAGLTVEPLHRFAGRALEVARAIHAARGRIPPPPCMASALEAWQLVAHKLEGSLETARMAVVGSIEGAPVELETTWDGDASPETTLVRTVPNAPPRREQEVTWEGGRFTEGGREGLPEACLEVLDRLLEKALGFSIDDREILLVLPAPVSDAAELLDAAHGVVGIASALRVGAGPYR